MRLRRLGDSALEFELLAWVADPMRDNRAVHALNRAIYRRFDADGVEIPFPQREVRLRESAADDAVAGVAGPGVDDGLGVGNARE